MIADGYIYQILVSLLFFLAINALLLIDGVGDLKLKFRLSFIILIICALVLALHGRNIGTDSEQYAAIFEGKLDYVGGLEPGYWFLNEIVGFFFDDYFFLYFAISSIFLILHLIAFRKITRNYCMAMSFLLSTFYVLNANTNVMRQGLAGAFVFLAMGLLFQGRRLWPVLMSGIAAISLHFTAAAILPAALLLKVRNIKKTMLLVAIMAVVFSFVDVMGVIGFLAQYSSYFERVLWYFSWGNSKPWHIKHIYYGSLILMAIYAVYLFAGRSLRHVQFLPLYATGFLYALAFSADEMMADRFYYYFFPVCIVLVVDLLDLISNKVLRYGIAYVGVMFWYAKTVFFQFPYWFVGN